eukprot:7575409-Ditylum_brightwellii.AAC.1
MAKICCKVQWKFKTAGFATEDIWNLRSLLPDMIYMRSIEIMTIHAIRAVDGRRGLSAVAGYGA